MTNLDKIREIDSDGLAYFLTDITQMDGPTWQPWCEVDPIDEECTKQSFFNCFRCCEKWMWEEVNQ